jgi:predicted dienelactone hydrolase
MAARLACAVQHDKRVDHGRFRLTIRRQIDSHLPMKKRYFAFGALGLLAIGGITVAAVNRIPEPPGPAGETPELGRVGDYAVGTVEKEYVFPNRARISAMGAVTGNLPAEDRRLKVRIWYPATADTSTAPTRYVHMFKGPGQPAFEIVMQGVSVTNALSIAAKTFPLVLMSHGFGGWNTQFSNLGEMLASHGYIVASIDHGDSPITSKSDALLSFGNVLLDRAQDQRQVLTRLLGEAKLLNIDSDKVAMLGYSMGGYGALATAGANYNPASETIARLPTAAQKIVTAATPEIAAKIDALVVLAPWGGQPDSRVWTAQSLSNITIPTLVISGDHDDIVNFREGVSWIFDQLSGADRHMLVYREARHNIVGNPVPFAPETAFPIIEFMNEPVWRQDRINMINQHFIRAFLDLHLKGDTAKAAYLEVPTEIAGNGDWPAEFGESFGGMMANDKQPKHWRGFQRRWALGLAMYKAGKGEIGKRTQPKK